MTFGQGQGNLWIDQPEGVGQLVMTRLRLNYGEWFVDLTQGTPWKTQVLGERTAATRDLVVRDRVLDTIGVTDIPTYGSRLDDTRTWSVAMTVQTIYGPVALVAAKLPGSIPPLPPAAPTGVAVAATALGIAGGTAITVVPADLTEPHSNIDFEIQALAAGSWP